MKVHHFLLAGLFVAGLGSAAAQTAPAKPATKPVAKPPSMVVPAKPAAAGKTLSMGGSSASGGGPILTREELRACLSREESIHKRLDELDGRRTPLNAERDQLNADKAELQTGRMALEDFKVKAEALNARTRDYATRVEAWNKRLADFNASTRPATQLERLKGEINSEREVLEKELKELEAARASLTAESEAGVSAFNAKAVALDGRVNTWNQRNLQVNEAAKLLEDERSLWLSECGNRRYREDDEAAIRRSK